MLVTPERVSKCLSRKVLVIATVLVNDVSKTTLKSPSAEMTLGFRVSDVSVTEEPDADSEVIDNGAFDTVDGVGCERISGEASKEGDVGICESLTGETSGDTALRVTAPVRRW